MTLAAVSDAGPLIHLAQFDSLGLLSAFDQFFVPETADEELTKGGVQIAGWLTSSTISSKPTRIEHGPRS